MGRVATEKEQVVVARIGTITLGVCAVLLGIVFEKQNVAYLVGRCPAMGEVYKAIGRVAERRCWTSRGQPGTDIAPQMPAELAARRHRTSARRPGSMGEVRPG